MTWKYEGVLRCTFYDYRTGPEGISIKGLPDQDLLHQDEKSVFILKGGAANHGQFCGIASQHPTPS